MDQVDARCERCGIGTVRLDDDRGGVGGGRGGGGEGEADGGHDEEEEGGARKPESMSTAALWELGGSWIWSFLPRVCGLVAIAGPREQCEIDDGACAVACDFWEGDMVRVGGVLLSMPGLRR